MMKRLSGAVLVLALMVSFFVFCSVDASAATEMSASEDLKKMIQESEGFEAVPYWDYSQWSVGFGNACPSEHLERYQKEGIPLEEAYALFDEQLAVFEKGVNKFMQKHSLDLSQQQFDALVAFTYGLGNSVLNNTSNTINIAVLNGATGNEMMFAFSIYCMAGGDFLPGLMRRRMAEANMYLNGEYDAQVPDSFCYVRYDPNGGVRDGCAQGYDSNLPAEPLSKPTYDGYVFVGWYTEPEGGVKITQLDETTAGMTLYAHWEKLVTATEKTFDPLKITVAGSAVHLRSGPGMEYGIVSTVPAGQQLTITGTTETDGMLWGLCSEGWISLNRTNYFILVPQEPEDDETTTQVKLPAYVTVTYSSGITVYNGPHTSYPQKQTLDAGTTVLVEKTVVFKGALWGYYEGGWIRLNSRVMIHDDSMLAHSFDVTVTASSLTVRIAPGTSYSKVTSVSRNSVHTVYAITMVDDVPWGKIGSGWICLDYTDYDSSKLEQYRNHVYGEWYNAESSTCVTHGTDRRDCLYCEQYETREAELGDHSYGEWYETKAPTTQKYGQERRDCQYCDHYETRQTDKLPVDSETKVYATITCDVLRIRSGPGTSYSQVGKLYNGTVVEILEIQTVGSIQWGRIEAGWICLTGYTEVTTTDETPHTHTYGDWYETKAPTTTEYGQERRDCTGCDHYETRQIDMLPSEDIIKVYATVTCDYLTVRTGPGSNYSRVGRINTGVRVEILEQVVKNGVVWGRTFTGWIWMSGYTTVETVVEEANDEMAQIMTVIAESLTIRAGAGTSYAARGYLYTGAKVKVYEIITVGSTQWARIETGWIMAKYLQ